MIPNLLKLCVPIVAGCLALAFADDEKKPEQTASPFSRRLMALDTNSDGKLSAGELKERHPDLLQKYDTNKDGLLSQSEIALAKPTGQRLGNNGTGPSRNGMGRRGGGGSGGGGFANADQILRFALTFDLDKDDGLNAAELKKFAEGLAARRSQGRRGQRPTQSDDTKKPQREPSEPSKAGLGQDGKGEGGFGDPPR